MGFKVLSQACNPIGLVLRFNCWSVNDNRLDGENVEKSTTLLSPTLISLLALD